jgi:glucose 1-dehydrogenase
MQGNGNLDGMVVAVTGAASGLGRVIAHDAAALGARVAVIDSDRIRLDAAVQEVAGSTGADVLGLAVDITDEAQVAGAAARIEGDLGTCRGLVNCAGVIRWGQPGIPGPADVGSGDERERHRGVPLHQASRARDA